MPMFDLNKALEKSEELNQRKGADVSELMVRLLMKAEEADNYKRRAEKAEKELDRKWDTDREIEEHWFQIFKAQISELKEERDNWRERALKAEFPKRGEGKRTRQKKRIRQLRGG
jgi:hypothetical protein